jgi:cytochrome c biogenesis protein CcdA
MVWAGVLITLLGFFITFASLGATNSTGVRLVMSLAGIAVSIFGILGVINKAYLKNALWKR